MQTVAHRIQPILQVSLVFTCFCQPDLIQPDSDRRISLSRPVESAQTLLGRILTKNLIQSQVLEYKSKEFCILMEKVVAWLLSVEKQVNEFITSLGSAPHVLSKTI